jgi:hypothetical protein
MEANNETKNRERERQREKERDAYKEMAHVISIESNLDFTKILWNDVGERIRIIKD